MRVFTCLTEAHDWRIVLLAVAMCLLGSVASISLFQRALSERGPMRYPWTFLAAVAAGSATWATHFIAMLGYDIGAPVSFDATLTIVSALIAVIGIGAGVLLAGARGFWLPRIAGGGTIGLAIAAMHYTGMFGYRVQGIVSWLPSYVIASIIFATVLGMLLVDRLRSSVGGIGKLAAIGLLAAAIVTLHFTGMAGFVVTPLAGVDSASNSQVYLAMALAIAMVALVILGTGLSTQLVEKRTIVGNQDALEHIAMHDALTELANRHSFEKALEREYRAIEQTGQKFALLLIDLDRFKPVNDTLGHPTGDIVLQKVAERLRRAVRPRDLVARMGGDEFAIIARGISHPEQVRALVDRVVEILKRPILVNGNVAELGGSVGVALAPEHGSCATEITQHADVALYAAKREGRDRHRFFEPQMMEALQRRRSLEADLRRACMREDFEVNYQPVIDSRTKAIIGVEALLRWTSDERGVVPPAEFIPVAEELGLVNRIGAGVLRQACLDAAKWGSIDVAVNVSPVQLLDPRLPQTVIQALDDSGLPASRLELEITETALLGNDELAFRTLTRLRELGVRISLDDFGTGYSSLSYLHRFPINRIKIDRSFVQRLPDDPGSASIVRAIAQLGASLDMKITAEGIETEEQFAFIAKHGCEHVQGFLISRPVTASEIRTMIDLELTEAVA